MNPHTIPRRLLALVVPVWMAGLAVAGGATFHLVTASHDAAMVAGVAALLLSSMVAERFPVPLDGVDAGGVSLSFVFGLAALVLFGCSAGVIVIFLAPTLMQLVDR